MAITYKVTVSYHGTQTWPLDGKLHREDGPAYETPNGYKEWCINGKFHRKDGPALVCPDGYKEYWLDGVRYTEAEFLAKTAPIKEMTMADIEALAGCRVKIIKE